jgi:hypothetical protein
MSSEWLTLVSAVLSDVLLQAIGMSTAVLILVIAISHLVDLTRSPDETPR